MSDAPSAGFEFVKKLGYELSAGKLDLPAFPDVAFRIKEILEDPDVTADKVAKVVSSDPVFTARLLQVANSALMNRGGGQVTDIRTAITRLGFRMVHNTAVSIAMEQVMLSKASVKIREQLKELWRHSIHVAAISYVLAKETTRLNADEAMLAGLLHDIGKFYILRSSEKYPEMFADSEALGEVMDGWHTGVGQAILDAWGFSPEVCAVANDHEDLEREHFGAVDLTDVVTVANLFDNKERNPELDWEQVAAVKRLGLTPEKTHALIEEFKHEVQSIYQALKG